MQGICGCRARLLKSDGCCRAAMVASDHCRVEWKQEHTWSVLTCREVWEEWKENREGMGRGSGREGYGGEGRSCV